MDPFGFDRPPDGRHKTDVRRTRGPAPEIAVGLAEVLHRRNMQGGEKKYRIREIMTHYGMNPDDPADRKKRGG